MRFSNRSHFAILALAIAALLSPVESLAARDDSPPRDSKLTSNDVLKVMDDEDWILVDTRETDAYNGWPLDGIQRGGHIPHAVDFPARWLDTDREDKTERLAAALRTKGIERNQHVVLYSTNETDRHRVAAYLRKRASGSSIRSTSKTGRRTKASR